MASKPSVTSYIKGLDAPLLWRVLLFAASFIIASAVIGPAIIAAGYVNRNGFQIYGGAGKALLFALITFLLLAYRARKQSQIGPLQRRQTIWFLGAVISLIMARYTAGVMTNGNSSFFWPLYTHIGIILTVVFSLLGSFGFQTLRELHKTYKHELRISFALGIGFVCYLYLVYGLWRVLATGVMHSVAWLLDLSGLTVFVIPPETLLLDKFGIAISQYCSGIDSIALFSALYVLVGIMDWGRINKNKYLGIFIPALILLFGMNILRVYGLILAGYYINAHIAFSLFHTYAGMVFFIVYSALFWKIMYKWMLKK